MCIEGLVFGKLLSRFDILTGFFFPFLRNTCVSGGGEKPIKHTNSPSTYSHRSPLRYENQSKIRLKLEMTLEIHRARVV